MGPDPIRLNINWNHDNSGPESDLDFEEPSGPMKTSTSGSGSWINAVYENMNML